MTFEIEINGVAKRVRVEPIGGADAHGGRFRVHVADPGVTSDGTDISQIVDARRMDLGLSMIFEAASRAVDVPLEDRGRGEWSAALPHLTLLVRVDGRRPGRGATRGIGAGADVVKAPMPGRVLRVLVRVGEEVTARQGLLIMEAMKMENELLAPRAGVIKEVATTEGASVEAGRVLVVFE